MAAPPSAIAASAAKPAPADTAVQIIGAETASRPTVPTTAAIRTTGTCVEVTVARSRCAFQPKCMSFSLFLCFQGESPRALAGWHPSIRRCELRGNTQNSLLDSLRSVIMTLSQDWDHSVAETSGMMKAQPAYPSAAGDHEYMWN